MVAGADLGLRQQFVQVQAHRERVVLEARGALPAMKKAYVPEPPQQFS